jgi:hypothetical protein
VITRTYGVLLHLYPRRFRRDYGDDMVLLLEDQLRDEGTTRVVGRALLDLLLTVPTRHLEAHMKRPSTTALVILFAAVGVVLAVFGGVIGVVAGLTSIALAVVAFRREQPVAAAAGDDGRWWKLLLGGVGLLGAEIAVTTITGELPAAGWFIAMLVGMTAIVLMAAGTVMGIAGRVRPKAA